MNLFVNHTAERPITCHSFHHLAGFGFHIDSGSSGTRGHCINSHDELIVHLIPQLLQCSVEKPRAIFGNAHAIHLNIDRCIRLTRLSDHHEYYSIVCVLSTMICFVSGCYRSIRMDL